MTEFEGYAAMMVEELTEFLHVEEQALKEAHDLHSRILAWQLVLQHLEEEIPTVEDPHYALYQKVEDYFTLLLQLIEQGEHLDLHFLLEEKDALKQHHAWRATYGEIKEGEPQRRVEIGHLRTFQTLLLDLMKLIKRNDLDVLHDSSEVGHFFTETYHFAKAYERIFRHLWRKERRLEGKLEERP